MLTNYLKSREALNAEALAATTGTYHYCLFLIPAGITLGNQLKGDTANALFKEYEVSPETGYERFAIDTSTGTGPAVNWQSSSNSSSREWLTSFTASPNKVINWNAEGFIKGGTNTSKQDISIAANGTITKIGHGYNDGDIVRIFPGPTSTATTAPLVTGVSYVKKLTNDTFQLHPDPSLPAPRTFTASGNGYKVAKVDGTVSLVGFHDSAQSVIAGIDPITVQIRARLSVL